MPYETLSFPTLGRGLNLRDKVDAVEPGWAIDCMNVEFTDRGAVKQRDGYGQFTSSALTTGVESIFPSVIDGTRYLLAGAGTRLEAMGTDGAVDASDASNTDAIWDFARTSTPTDELVYAGNGTNLLHTWNGSAWAQVASTPKAGALAVFGNMTNGANRLMAAKFDTTTGGPDGGSSTSNPSRVFFSDASAPQTWTTTNWVDLTPGDGEQVVALVAWRDFVFAFKETKFFVFTGESLDAAGAPIFDYYTVDTGYGVASPRAVAADETGVYFLSRQGVMRTTGSVPESVSDIIRPVFDGTTSSYWNGGELDWTRVSNCAMGAHDQKIYLALTTSGSTNNRMLVYDPKNEWWSIYDIAATCIASFQISSFNELVFGYPSGSNDIGRKNSSNTDDDGTAITSRWRSGWPDFGNTDKKKVRELKVWGSGACRARLAVDFKEAESAVGVTMTTSATPQTWAGGSDASDTWGDGLDASDTWGPDPASSALAGALVRAGAARGTVLNVEFTNAVQDKTWAIHRLDLHVPAIRKVTII